MIPIKKIRGIDIGNRIVDPDGTILIYRVDISFELSPEDLHILYTTLKEIGWVR